MSATHYTVVRELEGYFIHVASGTQKTSRGDKICGEVLNRGGHFTEKNSVAGNPKRCANDERKEALVVFV